MATSFDCRIADLEKSAPSAKRRPEGMTSDKFVGFVMCQAGRAFAELPEEVARKDFRARLKVMTDRDIEVALESLEAKLAVNGSTTDKEAIRRSAYALPPRRARRG